MVKKLVSPSSTTLSHNKKIFLIFIGILTALLAIGAIVIFVLYLAIPCIFAKCHQNANCINHPFFAECVCKYGYSGNAVDFCDECGLTFAENNLRVVGGVAANPHSWPSAVFIIASYKTVVDLGGDELMVSYEFSCGGSLIDRKTVLTAGHCIMNEFRYRYRNATYTIGVEVNEFHPNLGSIYKVFLGADKYIEPDYDIKPAEIYDVETAIRHEDFDHETFRNDIGILKLVEPATLNKYVQIACLPDPSIKNYPIKSDIDAYAIGWGAVYEGGYVPDSLRNVVITIYNNSMCSNVSTNPNDWESQICAGEWLGGKDTCQGDSGGPLFIIDKVGEQYKYVEVGIVSYGEGCAKKYLPGIYTRTSYFMNWIKKYTE